MQAASIGSPLADNKPLSITMSPLNLNNDDDQLSTENLSIEQKMARYRKRALNQRAKMQQSIESIDKAVTRNKADMEAFRKGADKRYEIALEEHRREANRK